MNPYYEYNGIKIYSGDCREILPSLSDFSSVVTDPPYELGFMGKSWDSQGISFQKETWEIIRKSCLSGSPLLSFGGSRTQHRIACAIEDAGWEIRDTLMWVYGSGFPKSENISIALDKQECRKRLIEKLGRTPSREEFKAEWVKFREIIGRWKGTYPDNPDSGGEQKTKGIWTSERGNDFLDITSPATPEARLWEGYGTALKPAYEPIILAMNPLDGTFANNALKHGVAGLNIDGCRIGTTEELGRDNHVNPYGSARTWNVSRTPPQNNVGTASKGRFPANFLHDGSQMVMELFPNTSSGSKPGHMGKHNINYKPIVIENAYGDNGSAARFFYCAKASKAERERGLEDLEPRQMGESRKEGNSGGDNPRNRGVHKVHNNHPTVKPLALMEYLVKLVKMPEYNLILDPFCGSGTTLLACIKLGIPCIGIDSDEQACEIAARRCQATGG
jgi:site-specific DNA-methyltransferase (adenine-specific)